MDAGMGANLANVGVLRENRESQIARISATSIISRSPPRVRDLQSTASLLVRIAVFPRRQPPYFLLAQQFTYPTTVTNMRRSINLWEECYVT
jgi:hypothetical protein